MDSLLSQLKRLHLSLQPSQLQLVAKEGRKVVEGEDSGGEVEEVSAAAKAEETEMVSAVDLEVVKVTADLKEVD